MTSAQFFWIRALFVLCKSHKDAELITDCVCVCMCGSQVTGDYDIYMYEDGYLRTSSEQFTLNLRSGGSGGPDAKMVHLTNYCMQKHSKNLGKFEEGNTLKLDDLQVWEKAFPFPFFFSRVHHPC